MSDYSRPHKLMVPSFHSVGGGAVIDQKGKRWRHDIVKRFGNTSDRARHGNGSHLPRPPREERIDSHLGPGLHKSTSLGCYHLQQKCPSFAGSVRNVASSTLSGAARMLSTPSAEFAGTPSFYDPPTTFVPRGMGHTVNRPNSPEAGSSAFLSSGRSRVTVLADKDPRGTGDRGEVYIKTTGRLREGKQATASSRQGASRVISNNAHSHRAHSSALSRKQQQQQQQRPATTGGIASSSSSSSSFSSSVGRRSFDDSLGGGFSRAAMTAMTPFEVSASLSVAVAAAAHAASENSSNQNKAAANSLALVRPSTVGPGTGGSLMRSAPSVPSFDGGNDNGTPKWRDGDRSSNNRKSSDRPNQEGERDDVDDGSETLMSGPLLPSAPSALPTGHITPVRTSPLTVVSKQQQLQRQPNGRVIRPSVPSDLELDIGSVRRLSLGRLMGAAYS